MSEATTRACASKSSSISSCRISTPSLPAPPERLLWVPGRLEIFGKHTDYGGGHTLVAPVPRGFIVAARPRNDAVVALHDATRRQDFVVAADRDGTPDEALKGWRRYALTVVRRLAKNFPGAALGADIAFGSDLAPASGMSSSSALMVGVATALVRLARLDARAEWQANIASASDAAGYYACIENGMAFGSLDGRRRRRHTRRQRRSHRHRLRQGRPRCGVDVRPSGARQRRPSARGLAHRDCVERRRRAEDRRGAGFVQQPFTGSRDAARDLERARAAGAIAARGADLEPGRGGPAARAAATSTRPRPPSTWRRGSPSSPTRTRASSKRCVPCATETRPRSPAWLRTRRRMRSGCCATRRRRPRRSWRAPGASAPLPRRASAPDSAAVYGRSSEKKTLAASRRAGCPSTVHGSRAAKPPHSKLDRARAHVDR